MSRKVDRSKRECARLLAHYFDTVFVAAGLTWTNDNATEIDTIFDYIEDLITDGTDEAVDARQLQDDIDVGHAIDEALGSDDFDDRVWDAVRDELSHMTFRQRLRLLITGNYAHK